MKTSDVESQLILDQLYSKDNKIKEKAWKLIYFKYYPTVKNFILKNNGSVEDSMDIFHDGLLILNKNIIDKKFQGNATIKTYLFSICKYLWLKRLKNKKDVDLLDLEEADNIKKSEIELQNSKSIESFLDQLSFDCKEILVEFYYRRKTMKELKERFNLSSVQAAKNKKYRCLSYLIKLLKEKGVNLEALNNNE